MSDFPHAETWWWVYSKREVSNDWLVNNLTELKKGALNDAKATEILLVQTE